MYSVELKSLSERLKFLKLNLLDSDFMGTTFRYYKKYKNKDNTLSVIFKYHLFNDVEDNTKNFIDVNIFIYENKENRLETSFTSQFFSNIQSLPKFHNEIFKKKEYQNHLFNIENSILYKMIDNQYKISNF